MSKKESKPKTKSIVVSGKRKRAIAKAAVSPGKGAVRINKKALNTLNPEFVRLRIQEALDIAGDVSSKVDIRVTVTGGGWSSQTEAARLAIAKALVEFTGSEELKRSYLDYDRHLLVADTRRKEPYKPNRSKARAKRQKSYR